MISEVRIKHTDTGEVLIEYTNNELGKTVTLPLSDLATSSDLMAKAIQYIHKKFDMEFFEEHFAEYIDELRTEDDGNLWNQN